MFAVGKVDGYFNICQTVPRKIVECSSQLLESILPGKSCTLIVEIVSDSSGESAKLRGVDPEVSAL